MTYVTRRLQQIHAFLHSIAFPPSPAFARCHTGISMTTPGADATVGRNLTKDTTEFTDLFEH